MLLYVNLSGADANDWPCEEARSRIERMANQECRTVSASDVSLDYVHDLSPTAILHGGVSTDVSHLAALKRVMMEWEGHQLAFCGGAQIAALHLGCTVDRVRRLREGEEDPLDWIAPGYFKECGLVQIEIVEDDPLFKGLPKRVEVYTAHASMIMNPASSMTVLARSDVCPVQAYAIKGRRFRGVQFHPEFQPVFHPHGHFIVQNFLDLAQSDADHV